MGACAPIARYGAAEVRCGPFPVAMAKARPRARPVDRSGSIDQASTQGRRPKIAEVEKGRAVNAVTVRKDIAARLILKLVDAQPRSNRERVEIAALISFHIIEWIAIRSLEARLEKQRAVIDQLNQKDI